MKDRFRERRQVSLSGTRQNISNRSNSDRQMKVIINQMMTSKLRSPQKLFTAAQETKQAE